MTNFNSVTQETLRTVCYIKEVTENNSSVSAKQEMDERMGRTLGVVAHSCHCSTPRLSESSEPATRAAYSTKARGIKAQT